jgi:hypothetical protein
MQAPPAAGQHQGRVIENEQGKRFVSDGKQWVPQ